MQRTEKYFEQDAFRTQCESIILAAEPDEKTGGGRIALDGTVFYPEGGGQPADRGTLTLPDGATLNVTDVHEHDGILWHSVDALPESAVPGTAVSGCIDWEWRFDKMQQHTGEHILSGILHQMFGAENVGFHIGSEAVRMDTSVPISAEGLQAAELAANRIVWQDVPVLVSYPTREELAALVYRSKKEIEGQVRIVTIPGADVCACCGTHTRTTGQVGQIKILASENYKGGVRLSVVCGQRALLAAQAMRQRQAEIGALLSAKADQTAVATYDIEQMVREIQSAVSAGVMGMDKFSEEVRRGIDEVGQVGEQLSQIIQQVQALAPRVLMVNEGMQAQATGAPADEAAQRRTPPTAADMIKILDQIPGIGPSNAQVIIAEIGLDMSRFPTAGHLVSWTRLCPRTIQSGKRSTTGKTGKGNRYLRAVLGEAAATGGKTQTFLGERYRRLIKRRGKLKTIVAIARSILVIIWHLLANPGTTFHDLGVDFNDQRIDIGRRTRNHVRQLEALGFNVTLTAAA